MCIADIQLRNVWKTNMSSGRNTEFARNFHNFISSSFPM